MRKPKQPDPASLEEIIDELTAEAGTDDERIWNFQRALQKHIWLPCDGSAIGETVTVIEFLYDGNRRRRNAAMPPPGRPGIRSGGLRRVASCGPHGGGNSISQEELARAVKTTANTVSRCCDGKSRCAEDAFENCIPSLDTDSQQKTS